MAFVNKLAAALFFIHLLDFVACSDGDKSYIFQKCLKNCSINVCAEETTFINNQPVTLWMLGWTCYAECKHECMWTTVDAFLKDGSPVPQFYGKWPFLRFLGLQEPAAVLFSILNAAGHLMLLQYRRKVSSSTPMYFVWHGFAVVAINAWIWSTIYHSRDTDITEMMDYFFALSIVMYNVFALVCRVVGTDRWWNPMAAAALLIVFYFQHTYYLAFVKFDYGYNMKVNIAVGMVSIVGWLTWCCFTRRKQRYVWQCVFTVLAINVSVLLELLDFPPLGWTLDAHALWHACTAPLTLMWWKFVIDDGIYLKEQEEFKKFA